MKNILLSVSLILIACSLAIAQERDLETDFFNNRAKIKRVGIIEITKRTSQYWKNQCVSDSAEIRFKYQFDDRGNLIRIDEFHSNRNWRSVKYVRDKNGNYTQKIYAENDSLGNVSAVQNWILEFNKKGQRITETLVYDKDTLRINKLTYDRKGRLIQTFANYSWLWTMEYDRKNRVIKRDECVLWGDSIRCRFLFRFKYENELLIRKTALYSEGVIAKQYDYYYDSNHLLISVKEERYSWRQKGLEQGELDQTYVTTFTYDNRGNCVEESEYNEGSLEPFRCTYYDYKYK